MPALGVRIYVPNAVQSILDSQNTPEAPKNNAHTPIMLPYHAVGRLVSRLNHGLDGFRAISAYEPAWICRGNLTLRGLHPKSQAAIATAMIRRGAREKWCNKPTLRPSEALCLAPFQIGGFEQRGNRPRLKNKHTPPPAWTCSLRSFSDAEIDPGPASTAWVATWWEFADGEII